MGEACGLRAHPNQQQISRSRRASNTLLVYGSCIRDGDRHDHADLPTIMAGRAGGVIPTGRFHKLKESAPMSNFFLTLADLHGVQVERHGDSTGKLSMT